MTGQHERAETTPMAGSPEEESPETDPVWRAVHDLETANDCSPLPEPEEPGLAPEQHPAARSTEQTSSTE
jgi:hypothetical protein